MKSLVKLSDTTQVAENEGRNLTKRTITNTEHILQDISHNKEELIPCYTADFRKTKKEKLVMGREITLHM